MTGSLGIKAKVKDEFSGIKKIDGYIDGDWVVFDYDQKNDLIYYQFDNERLTKNKKHQLLIVITDNKNNQNRFECDFFW